MNIIIRDVSFKIEEEIIALRREYSEKTNSKAILHAIENHISIKRDNTQLRAENFDLRRKLDRCLKLIKNIEMDIYEEMEDLR